MTDEISLRCKCGAVTGVADLVPEGTRLVCMCRSCQAYARFLGREADMLDEYGGTDIYQLTPAQVRIEQGVEQLRCVRVSKRGPLRWYSNCCKTPVGNTLSVAWVPFIGMPHVFMDHAAAGCSRDDALGPIRFRVNARHAKGAVEGAHRTGPPSLVVRAFLGLLYHLARGLNRPSPFFDLKTGEPMVSPAVLNSDERAAIGLS